MSHRITIGTERRALRTFGTVRDVARRAAIGLTFVLLGVGLAVPAAFALPFVWPLLMIFLFVPEPVRTTFDDADTGRRTDGLPAPIALRARAPA